MSPSAITPLDSEKVVLVRVAHVYYTHAGFEREHQFLTDFGFTEVSRLNVGKSNETIYYRGYGTEPWLYCSRKGEEDAFGGAAFVVESRKDLELATRVIPTASEIWEMKDAPGGGECVTVKDPVDGFEVHLVYGQVQREAEEHHEPRAFNYVGAFSHTSDDERRRLIRDRFSANREASSGQQIPTHGKRSAPANLAHRLIHLTVTPSIGPSLVHKLGHFGLCVTDFAKTFNFWTSHFNLKPSDLLHDPEGRDITSFLHLDRGLDFVDHHCFFFFQGPKTHVHHSSFEVFDFDTQVLGHDWLMKKGYENCWGVGRHILGSQIFDYWYVLPAPGDSPRGFCTQWLTLGV